MSLHYRREEAKIGFGNEKETKFVGRRQLADPFTLERLAKEISHITGLPQATAEIVLRYMVQAIEDAIADGRSVDMGIGTLSPAISTTAADEAKDVKIRRKRVLFRASKHLRTIVQNMSIKLITDEDDGNTDTAPEDNTTTEPSPNGEENNNGEGPDYNGGNGQGGGGQN